MQESFLNQSTNADWLSDVLEEVNLQNFHSKLTNDLQLTKLSHFDYVSEEDLVQLGLSRPAAKRLLAAVKKRKSFVNTLKNRIVCKLLPSGGSQTPGSSSSSARNKFESSQNSPCTGNLSQSPMSSVDANKPNSEFGRLTCLINSQDIHIKEEIGNGVHGFVKKGEWTTPNGRVVEVALKILKKDVISEPGASFNDFVKEISVMHQLNHPNIIKLYGVVLSSPMMMVTELAPFGNLRDKLRKEEGRTPISLLINFGVQIASGMAYLESKRFVHRDLATRNIFITHGRKILIGDLGLMRAIPNHDNHYVMSERTKIPYPWCAPESLKYKQFSNLSDVYMFGVTLWEMFTFGKEPWAGLNLNEILENISTQEKRLPCPDACPTMVYQTLLQCWSTEPSLRPNFHTLYQYLSTSYPLEVICNQLVSELGQKRTADGSLIPDDLSDSYSKLRAQATGISRPDLDRTCDDKTQRKILTCQVSDRILVIDGQPEKFWWKGQNQRTFDIGWFPLSSTRWQAPKKGANYISKPLKNSFVNKGHAGPDSHKFIDRVYLRASLVPDDIDSAKATKSNVGSRGLDKQTATCAQTSLGSNLFFKQKARSKLSRLFGITDGTNNHNHIINHSYHKFTNEQSQSSSSRSNGLRTEILRNSLMRSQSDEFNTKRHLVAPQSKNPTDKPSVDDQPALIDFSEEPLESSHSSQIDRSLFSDVPKQTQPNQESILDMDNMFPSFEERFNLGTSFQRTASDTKLDQMDDNYHLSWAGSWNTGTFYESNSNIYSAYYCPQDAGIVNNVTFKEPPPPDAISYSRYYSAVAQDDKH